MVRHILFTFPGMIATALIAILIITRMLKPYRRLYIAFLVSLILYVSMMGITYMRINPYQYVFYNSFVGGLRGAKDRHKLDYWGHSLKELVEKTADKLPKGKFFKFQVHNVVSGQADYHFNEFMFLTSREDYDCLFTPTEVNFVEGFKKTHPHLREFASVKRMGVTLSQTLCKEHVFK